MRWDDERYVRLYTRDTPEWSVLEWEARAVFYELLRKVDRAGFVPLGKSRLRGLAGLLRMPVDVVTKGVDGLIEDGCIELTDSGVIVRNFIEAQEAKQTDKARQRACRERARDIERARVGDDDYGQSRDVTNGHTPSREVTPGHSVPSCAETIQTDPIPPECVSPDPRPPASQEPSQSTRTQSAESYELPSLPDADWLAAELRRYPAVERFAADGDLVADIASGLQMKAQTIARAREVVLDFVTKTGLEARSMDRAEFQRRFGGYVTSSRLRGTKIALVPQGAPRAPPVLCVAFARGHEAQGAAGYPVPTDPREEAALASVIAARCPTLHGDASADWITHAVKRFLRARAADPDSKFWKGGDGVHGFVTWIGTEKKADAERAEVLRLAASVPSMTDDELLEYDRKQREERRNAAMVKPPDTPTVRRVAPNFPNPYGVTRTRP